MRDQKSDVSRSLSQGLMPGSLFPKRCVFDLLESELGGNERVQLGLPEQHTEGFTGFPF